MPGRLRALRLVALLTVVYAPTPTQAQSLRELCEGFEQAEFTARYRCISSPQGSPKGDANLVSRFERYERATQRCRELLNFSLSNKRVRVDGSAAKRCVEAHRNYMQDPARTRARENQMRTACDVAVIGLQKQGMACDSALECARGLSCLAAPGKVEKSCAKPLTKGSFCDEDAGAGAELHAVLASVRSVCEAGTHCGPTSSSAAWRCVADTAPLKVRKAVGEACKENGDCRVGNFCAADKCTAARSSGNSCATDDECRGYCKTGRCADACGSG